MAEASGWAVISNTGNIFVKSVSDTRRAAIVNWLVVEHYVPIGSHHRDADIERMWEHFGSRSVCKEVKISG